MKKLYFLTIIIVCVACLLTFIIISKKSNVGHKINLSKKANNPEINLCIEKINLDYIGQCYTEIAIHNLNYNYCAKIYDPIKDRVDPEWNVNYTSAETYRMKCKNKVFDLTIKNANDCEKIDKQIRNDCYNFVGIFREDGSACGKITDLDGSRQCYYDASLFLLNETLCNKIDNNKVRNNCITVIAGTKNDSSICNSIEDDYDKESCLDDMDYWAGQARIEGADSYRKMLIFRYK
jgi:hypothetical protein